MRAAVVDQRLEAVAGTPVVDVTAPSVAAGAWTPDHTAIFVGQWAETEPGRTDSQGQQTITGIGGPFAYVRAYTPDWGAFDQPITRIKQGSLFQVVAHPVSTTTTIALGRHTVLPTLYSWVGPMRGVIYPRILTQSEVQAVINRIAGIL